SSKTSDAATRSAGRSLTSEPHGAATAGCFKLANDNRGGLAKTEVSKGLRFGRLGCELRRHLLRGRGACLVRQLLLVSSPGCARPVRAPLCPVSILDQLP